MLVVPKREKEGWFRPQDIDNFPCEDIRTKLWVFSFPSRFVISIQPNLISETLRDMSGSPL